MRPSGFHRGGQSPTVDNADRDASGILLIGKPAWDTDDVSREEVDRYIAGVNEPGRTTLTKLRDVILQLVPDAEEGLAYGSPAFKVRGKTVAGFAAFTSHLSYLPHSGSTLAAVSEHTVGYETSKGALKFGTNRSRRHW